MILKPSLSGRLCLFIFSMFKLFKSGRKSGRISKFCSVVENILKVGNEEYRQVELVFASLKIRFIPVT